jgi:hypothetical protein
MKFDIESNFSLAVPVFFMLFKDRSRMKGSLAPILVDITSDEIKKENPHPKQGQVTTFLLGPHWLFSWDLLCLVFTLVSPL